jgi:SAM-dependent methyltransferase
MAERYDRTAALHYAAYRPPLHRLILARILPAGARFEVGLDVGSGTGYSAVALAEWCARVHAVEPSEAMRSRAAAHEHVTYLAGSAERLPLPGDSVDLVTFAGSLSYADRDAARRELARVCREGATVIVYDFEVMLDEVLRSVGAEPPPEDPAYDHAVNFSGAPGLRELEVRRERVSVPVTPGELAHVLLSDSGRLDRLARQTGEPDPFPVVEARLRERYARDAVDAELYHSVYRVEK